MTRGTTLWFVILYFIKFLFDIFLRKIICHWKSLRNRVSGWPVNWVWKPKVLYPRHTLLFLKCIFLNRPLWGHTLATECVTENIWMICMTELSYGLYITYQTLEETLQRFAYLAAALDRTHNFSCLLKWPLPSTPINKMVLHLQPHLTYCPW